MWKIETLIKWTGKQYQSVDGGRKRLELHACTFLHFWLSAVSERTSTSVRYQIDHRSSMFRDYAAWNYTFKWSERESCWLLFCDLTNQWYWFIAGLCCRAVDRSEKLQVEISFRWRVRRLITIFSRFALCSFPLFISDVIVMSMFQFFFVWCNSRYFAAATEN